uniref:MYND-type domain-containing protein n=1 Tax=Mycena chlorophos TaxID=658473 RepID=A0ABQ0M7B9_MYCCL|nr:predicted protein [Mycena chlorophos]
MEPLPFRIHKRFMLMYEHDLPNDNWVLKTYMNTTTGRPVVMILKALVQHVRQDGDMTTLLVGGVGDEYEHVCGLLADLMDAGQESTEAVSTHRWTFKTPAGEHLIRITFNKDVPVLDYNIHAPRYPLLSDREFTSGVTVDCFFALQNICYDEEVFQDGFCTRVSRWLLQAIEVVKYPQPIAFQYLEVCWMLFADRLPLLKKRIICYLRLSSLVVRKNKISPTSAKCCDQIGANLSSNHHDGWPCDGVRCRIKGTNFPSGATLTRAKQGRVLPTVQYLRLPIHGRAATQFGDMQQYPQAFITTLQPHLVDLAAVPVRGLPDGWAIVEPALTSSDIPTIPDDEHAVWSVATIDRCLVAWHALEMVRDSKVVQFSLDVARRTWKDVWLWCRFFLDNGSQIPPMRQRSKMDVFMTAARLLAQIVSQKDLIGPFFDVGGTLAFVIDLLLLIGCFETDYAQAFVPVTSAVMHALGNLAPHHVSLATLTDADASEQGIATAAVAALQLASRFADRDWGDKQSNALAVMHFFHLASACFPAPSFHAALTQAGVFAAITLLLGSLSAYRNGDPTIHRQAIENCAALMVSLVRQHITDEVWAPLLNSNFLQAFMVIGYEHRAPVAFGQLADMFLSTASRALWLPSVLNGLQLAGSMPPMSGSDVGFTSLGATRALRIWLVCDIMKRQVKLYETIAAVPHVNRKMCEACGKIDARKTMKRCRTCQDVYYCDRDCQKQDWRRHRRICEFLARTRHHAAALNGQARDFVRRLADYTFGREFSRLKSQLLDPQWEAPGCPICIFRFDTLPFEVKLGDSKLAAMAGMYHGWPEGQDPTDFLNVHNGHVAMDIVTRGGGTFRRQGVNATAGRLEARSLNRIYSRPAHLLRAEHHGVAALNMAENNSYAEQIMQRIHDYTIPEIITLLDGIVQPTRTDKRRRNRLLGVLE